MVGHGDHRWAQQQLWMSDTLASAWLLLRPYAAMFGMVLG
jgi:hypothetical protein